MSIEDYFDIQQSSFFISFFIHVIVLSCELIVRSMLFLASFKLELLLVRHRFPITGQTYALLEPQIMSVPAVDSASDRRAW